MKTFKTATLVGIGSPNGPPSKQCGGWWVVGRGWRKIRALPQN